MTHPERWTAPDQDGAILCDPAPQRVGEILETNRRRLAAARSKLLGQSLADLRVVVSERVRERIRRLDVFQSHFADRQIPFIVAGHQPELFHPGVWLKNFALNGLARRHDLIPLNLNVDGDTVKSTSLHFPVSSSDPAKVHRLVIPFDSWDGESPYAFRTIHDPELFRSFPDRAREVEADWGFKPILDDFWKIVLEERSRLAAVTDRAVSQVRLGEVLASARRVVETRWGCRNVELPLSRVSFIPELFAHVLADLPRFHEVYNACLGDYRRKHGLKSPRHPAPDLEKVGDRLEAPFWWFDQLDKRRQRLFVQDKGDRLVLFAGADARPVEVKRGSADAVRELAESGVLIYTRAMMTTMFIRICLADLFIHGIGGAKYDEVTDNIIRRYFDMDPPEYLVVSGTLRLPLPRFSSKVEDRRRLIRHIRDLRWTPERFVATAEPAVLAWVDEKRRQLELQPTTHLERRTRYRELLRLTEALRPFLADEIAESERELTQCEHELAANEMLTRRDYSFVLYPEDPLRSFCTQFL